MIEELGINKSVGKSGSGIFQSTITVFARKTEEENENSISIVGIPVDSNRVPPALQ
jgi:hypothetical protein